LDQRLPLVGGKLETIRVGGCVGDILGALVGIMRECMQGGCELDQLWADGRIVRAVITGLRLDEAQRGIVVMPARIEREDVGLALAKRAGRAGPTAQLDIAGL